MTSFLAGQQRDHGGWSYARGVHQTDVDDTSYAAQLLALRDRRGFRPQLEAARGYLLAMQGRDGGWPTYERGQPSEAAMTAGAIEALAMLHRPGAPASPSIARGARFLQRAQRPDGSFECSWSRAGTNAWFRVRRALDQAAVSAPVEAIRRSVGDKAGAWLAATRAPGGGWGHRAGDPADAVSTAYGLLGLGSGEPDAIRDGLTELLRHQRADGSFDAPSDQQGPRPLVWACPQVNSAVATWGLARGVALAARARRSEPVAGVA